MASCSAYGGVKRAGAGDPGALLQVGLRAGCFDSNADELNSSQNEDCVRAWLTSRRLPHIRRWHSPHLPHRRRPPPRDTDRCPAHPAPGCGRTRCSRCPVRRSEGWVADTRCSFQLRHRAKITPASRSAKVFSAAHRRILHFSGLFGLNNDLGSWYHNLACTADIGIIPIWGVIYEYPLVTKTEFVVIYSRAWSRDHCYPFMAQAIWRVASASCCRVEENIGTRSPRTG